MGVDVKFTSDDITLDDIGRPILELALQEIQSTIFLSSEIALKD